MARRPGPFVRGTVYELFRKPGLPPPKQIEDRDTERGAGALPDRDFPSRDIPLWRCRYLLPIARFITNPQFFLHLTEKAQIDHLRKRNLSLAFCRFQRRLNDILYRGLARGPIGAESPDHQSVAF